MKKITAVPEFRPSLTWLEDWPYGEDTVVQVAATVSGPGADAAVADFVSSLHRNDFVEPPEGVDSYYWGGFTADVSRDEANGQWRLVFGSGGQDGFESARAAADDLVEYLRKASDEVNLEWQELPAEFGGDGS